MVCSASGTLAPLHRHPHRTPHPRHPVRTCPHPSEIPPHFVHVPLGRGQADPLHTLAGHVLEPLQAERQMRAALGGHECVDLVDDQGVDGLQAISCVRGEQQEQRFGRRDQDVCRLALEPGAIGRRGVAGADGDRRRMETIPPGQRHVRDPGQRGAKVPLDVDGERFQRRNVDDATATQSIRHGLEHQTIQAPQEGRQRLPGPRRGEDERRFPSADGRPPVPLGAGRPFERRLKPRTTAGWNAGRGPDVMT